MLQSTIKVISFGSKGEVSQEWPFWGYKECLVVQSCQTLWDPMGILQARIVEWVAMLFSRRSSQPKYGTHVSRIAGEFFTIQATREAQEYWSGQPIPSPGDLPNPEIKPGSPALQADSLPAELPGKPQKGAVQFSSVQFSCSVMSNSLQLHGLQHTRPQCPSPTPRVYSNSCPLRQWCHPTNLSSFIPFSSCLISFPASGSFPESVLHSRWPKCWSFSFSISSSNEYSGLISFRMD